MHSWRTFLQAALEQYSTVGTFLPTPSRTKKIIGEQMEIVSKKTRNVIVEYGPGTKSLFPDHVPLNDASNIFLIEKIPEFASYLRDTIDDERINVICGDALSARSLLKEEGIDEIDCAISGIPFSTMKPEDMEKIVRETYELLAPGGMFIVYQFRKTVLELLQNHFDTVDTKRIWLSTPPLYVFVARKVEK